MAALSPSSSISSGGRGVDTYSVEKVVVSGTVEDCELTGNHGAGMTRGGAWHSAGRERSVLDSTYGTTARRRFIDSGV
jgi:hypothetical protein